MCRVRVPTPRLAGLAWRAEQAGALFRTCAVFRRSASLPARWRSSCRQSRITTMVIYVIAGARPGLADRSCTKVGTTSPRGKFGMRVVKFSIGFGPTLWSRAAEGQPDGLPSRDHPLPGVRPIAGMNPYEDNDPEGPGQLHERVALGADRDDRRGSADELLLREHPLFVASWSAESRSSTRRCASAWPRTGLLRPRRCATGIASSR